MKWDHIPWGETTNWPVLPLLVTTVDGRAIIASIPVLLHLSLNSIYFMLTGFLVFGILERFGYDIRTLYRMARRKAGGKSMRSRNEYRTGFKKSGIFSLSIMVLMVMATGAITDTANAATYITKNTYFMEGGKVISSDHYKNKPSVIPVRRQIGQQIRYHSHNDVKMAPQGRGVGLPFSIMVESVMPRGWNVIDNENIVTSWNFTGNQKWYEAIIDWAEPLEQYLLVINYDKKTVELRGVER